jgi:hypothetical protein
MFNAVILSRNGHTVGDASDKQVLRGAQDDNSYFL